MKDLLIPLFAVFASVGIQAQTYKLTDLEAQFLQQNTQLIASKFNINRSEAEIVQEKLWNNPTLSISEVNLWKTYQVDQQPFLIGKYGKNQQISVELEQLIETAGKRKKRVAIKELEKNSTVFEYEELMRQLRKDLRLNYYQLQRINQEEIQLNEIVNLFTQLKDQYYRQVQLKNIAQADYYRVQTELINFKKEQIDLVNQRIQVLNQLRILTHNSGLEVDQLSFSQSTNNLLAKLPLDIFQIAKNQNIQIRYQANELDIANKQLELAKAQRKPDLMLQMNYDRGGNIMRDFVGVGVSFELPVFNTNKGNIKAAQFGIDQQKNVQLSVENNLKQTIVQLQSQLQLLEESFNEWPSDEINEQKKMIENYKKHLRNKQVTLIEFIDFTRAYREATIAYLLLQQNYQETFEELQYIVGQDF